MNKLNNLNNNLLFQLNQNTIEEPNLFHELKKQNLPNHLMNQQWRENVFQQKPIQKHCLFYNSCH